MDSRLNGGRGTDDQVGIIAIEIMPISFRITHSALRSDEMGDEIQAILKHHEFDKPILVSHSYGTVIATQLLKSPLLADHIGPIVLIDPISVLLHLPDVAYNFTRRKPRRANEHQLYYFASMDMGVSHSLSRCFFWSENILWKHDIADRLVTISLAEQDLIVDTKAVANYLSTHNDEVAAEKRGSHGGTANGSVSNGTLTARKPDSRIPHPITNGQVKSSISNAIASRHVGDGSLGPSFDADDWKRRRWVGEGLDVLWFSGLDHAQVFDTARTRDPLIEAIAEYSARPC
jgi:hypothetical protein